MSLINEAWFYTSLPWNRQQRAAYPEQYAIRLAQVQVLFSERSSAAQSQIKAQAKWE